MITHVKSLILKKRAKCSQNNGIDLETIKQHSVKKICHRKSMLCKKGNIFQMTLADQTDQCNSFEHQTY